MTNTARLLDIVERLMRCWDRRDIEAALNHYTDDVHYAEPGAGLSLQGRAALRRHLEECFHTWDARWHIREYHRLEHTDALAVFWDLDIARNGDFVRLLTKGMHVVTVRGDQVCSDLIYYDRTQLAPLLQKPAAQRI